MRYEETKPNSERQKDSDCSNSQLLWNCVTQLCCLMAFVLPSGYGCASHRFTRVRLTLSEFHWLVCKLTIGGLNIIFIFSDPYGLYNPHFFLRQCKAIFFFNKGRVKRYPEICLINMSPVSKANLSMSLPFLPGDPGALNSKAQSLYEMHGPDSCH